MQYTILPFYCHLQNSPTLSYGMIKMKHKQNSQLTYYLLTPVYGDNCLLMLMARGTSLEAFMITILELKEYYVISPSFDGRDPPCPTTPTQIADLHSLELCGSDDYQKVRSF